MVLAQNVCTKHRRDSFIQPFLYLSNMCGFTCHIFPFVLYFPQNLNLRYLSGLISSLKGFSSESLELCFHVKLYVCLSFKGLLYL